MKNLFLFLAISLWCTNIHAQITGPLPQQFQSIRQNTVSNLDAEGNRIWLGPKFNFKNESDLEWNVPETADSVVTGRMSNFSFSLSPDTVVSGLGWFKELPDGSVPTAGGVYISTDNGFNFAYFPPPLDEQGSVARFSGSDSLRGYYHYPYGDSSVLALAITVPEQSVPYDISHRGNALFLAGWASGIRRSLDFGQTWTPLLLPPFEYSELTPNSNLNFIFQPTPPARSDVTNPNSGISWTNFVGFSTHIDSDGYVWAGTAGGINISPNALFAPTSEVEWQHKVAGFSSENLVGNWIIEIEENPFDKQIWMTNWVGTNAAGEEQFGLVSTADKGATFSRYLIGERIYSVGFDGETIVAGGDQGLFVSYNNGKDWRQIREIRGSDVFVKPGTAFQSIAKSDENFWIGTTDGVLSTPDFEQWTQYKVHFPLSGGNQFQDAKNVKTYAYPNPFSPRNHSVVRIVFESGSNEKPTLHLFDFAMNRIRSITETTQSGGVYEFLWNGQNQNGQYVANGVVFYTIQTEKSNISGKIIVLE